MIVHGGQLVTPQGSVRTDLAVEDGRIAAIAPELPGAREEIDARGMAIFPGLMICLTVLSVNYVGDGLRDALDPTRTF